jgi:cytochrome c peroxidase
MFPQVNEAKSKVGQLLFYDPILSGNRNISCGTCHHHDHFSADGVSLGIGEGGVGVGPKRVDGAGSDQIKKRVPRHAPALWNIGAHEFKVLFHDGRLSESDDYGNGINSPAQEFLPDGLDSVLAAQALFPMVAQFEMAGNPRENEIAGAVHDRIDTAWPILAARVNAISEYKAMLGEVSISTIANALGSFMDSEWRSFDSPYDLGTMTAAQIRGAALFNGDAGCSNCHSGPFQTDHDFHAIGLPPFGPGRTRQFESIARDVGRMSESDALEDAYKFRTPSLRNVALTAPYGHNGAYPTLEGIIRHHLNPKQGFETWTPKLAALPSANKAAIVDFLIWDDTREMTRQRAAVTIEPVDLNNAQIADLVAFMHALTGGNSRYGRLGRPDKVPSGLAVD